MSRIITPEPTVVIPPPTVGEKIFDAIGNLVVLAIVLSAIAAERLGLTEREPPADSYD